MKKFFLFQLFCIITSLAYAQDAVYVYKDNVSGLYGLRTANSIVVKGLYDNVQALSDQTFVFDKDGHKGLLSNQGKVLLKPVFQDIKNYGFDTYLVNGEGKWGVINRYEKTIIPIKYSSFKPLSTYLYEVSYNGKKGLASTLGSIVVEPSYQEINKFSDDMFVLKKGQNIYVVDNLGKPIFTGNYDSLERLQSSNFYEVRRTGKKGLIDINGTAILDPIYDDIDMSDPYYTLLKKDSKFGFLIDKKCIPAVYDKVVFIQEDLGVIAVKQGSMTGFVTFTGDVVQPIYENLSRFAPNGYAFAERGGKLMCVDRKGKEKPVQEVMGKVKY